MATSYMRVFNAPPSMGEGTVFTMSASVTEVVDDATVKSFMDENDLSVEEIARQDRICRDQEGHLMSWREVIIRPPLTDEQVQRLGRLTADASDCGHNFAYVVDCRTNPEELYGDIIAGA